MYLKWIIFNFHANIFRVDEETVICALFHDVGEVITPSCHGEIGLSKVSKLYEKCYPKWLIICLAEKIYWSEEISERQIVNQVEKKILQSWVLYCIIYFLMNTSHLPHKINSLTRKWALRHFYISYFYQSCHWLLPTLPLTKTNF